MHSIEEQALLTYQENLTYLQQKHPTLYDKLIALDTALSENILPENYTLEYKDNSYFDIQEISTKHFLYNEDSYHYTNKLLNQITLDRTGSVFEGQQRFTVNEKDLEEIGSFKNFHSSLWATAKILHYNQKVAPKESSQMIKLYKFIFFGTGLGLHVEKIINKYKPEVVFIHEKNLELFRLSLFVTNYAQQLKNTSAYFSIMQDHSEMQNMFMSFLNDTYNYNLYIKFLAFSNDYREDLKSLQSITISQTHLLYPYQAFMARSLNAIEKISNNNYFLNVSKHYSDTIFSKYPVLILASGPSLQNNIQWIKNNQDKFIVVAVLSACKYLFLHDVIPDIIVHIDPEEKPSLEIIEDIDMSKFNNSTIVFGSSVHKNLLERFKNNNTFVIEEGTTFKVDYGYHTNSSIGEYAATLPLTLGATNIFLLGLDLSLDPKTMKDHIDTHISLQTLSHEDPDADNINFDSSICYVKGNFLDVVPSKPNFRFSIIQFTKSLQMYKKAHQNIYNLSNGAYLNDTAPLSISELNKTSLPKLNKETIHSEITEFFLKNSSSELRKIDKSNILNEVETAKNILKECKRLRKIRSKEPRNYLKHKLIPFVSNISETGKKDKSDIASIYFEYFKISLSFIFDTLNTNNVKNMKKHVEIIDEIVLDEIEKIASTYCEKIESYLNEV